VLFVPSLLQLQLVNEITTNGLTLVKDPYGNYVVQYVLDLPYPRMLANLILQFKTHLSELSTQKFSSNVVEKVPFAAHTLRFFLHTECSVRQLTMRLRRAQCLNVCDPVTRAWMVKELTESEHLKSLIQVTILLPPFTCLTHTSAHSNAARSQTTGSLRQLRDPDGDDRS
jgi:hypothetical protein